jgi:hypothetical protein
MEAEDRNIPIFSQRPKDIIISRVSHHGSSPSDPYPSDWSSRNEDTQPEGSFFVHFKSAPDAQAGEVNNLSTAAKRRGLFRLNKLCRDTSYGS